MLKGKGGRFRQNLLGKRVDYSGRSVIVGGPDLKLNQCGLPKKMALTLFEPFIIRRLKELGYCHTVRSAKKLIDRKTTEVWDILEEVTQGHPVMLNRAPTLHRLSIQAFEPVLIEGSAIRVHPLVCTAYNADFDGDQMAVHVPLSVEAQMEARQLMLATNNIFSPSSGKPITTPSQDIILGSYYLTFARERTQADRENKDDYLPLFDRIEEVEYALAQDNTRYMDYIRYRNPDFGKDTVYGDKDNKYIETTLGRVRFNEIWPDEIGFINRNVGKKQMGDIIWRCYQKAGKKGTVQSLDLLKNLGFREAMRSGASIGLVDMMVPEDKPELLEGAYKEIAVVEKQFKSGIITDGERYQKVIDIWTRVTDTLANEVYRKIEHNFGRKEANSLYMMVDSGARGNKAQIKQLAGMRGLMAKPSGEIIERPITSNFREGLSVLEYFISTHGARKGLADTALKTADSGYMTRKLVDVAQDVIITEPDCGTIQGITINALSGEDDDNTSLADRVYGRVSCERVVDPVTQEIVVNINELIDEKKAERLESIGHERLKIRSVLTCESERGCCAKCYGLNLATGNLGKMGEAVGIIAAQSIGEPGTQLTMRTFHTGGVAFGSSKQPFIITQHAGKVVYKDVVAAQDEKGNYVVLNKVGQLIVRNDEGLEVESHNLVKGSSISIKDGEFTEKDQKIVTWDPFSEPIVTEKGGLIEFRDMIPGITVEVVTDKESGKKGMSIIEHKEDLHPQVVILDSKSKDVLGNYSIPVGATLDVQEGDKVGPGSRLARTPRKAAKTRDITGGLPRIAELFEARKPKDACVIAMMEGTVSYGPNVRGKKKVIVTNPDTLESRDHLIPVGKHVIVNEGDILERGDQITEGPTSPEDLLEACGAQELQEHLVNEVQNVYRMQGVEINDKHVEIIIRQMLRKVKISEPGDTDFLWGDQLDRTTFRRVNREIEAQGGQPAECDPVLLGITKASLETESFISAASFQDTTRVLTEAATLGKTDVLNGFKENVIMGHLIPAGTGFRYHRNLEVNAPNSVFVKKEEEVEEGAEALTAAEATEQATQTTPNAIPGLEDLEGLA